MSRSIVCNLQTAEGQCPLSRSEGLESHFGINLKRPWR